MIASRKDPILQRIKRDRLAGRWFRFTRWTKPNPEWTHDHCSGCRAHICDNDDKDWHEGYVTVYDDGDENWLCPKCFEWYRLVLNLRLRN